MRTRHLRPFRFRIHRQHTPQIIVGNGCHTRFRIWDQGRTKSKAIRQRDVWLQLPHQRIGDEVIHGRFHHIITHQSGLCTANHRLQFLAIRRFGRFHQRKHFSIGLIHLRVYIHQIIMVFLHDAIFYHDIQFGYKRTKCTGLRYLGIFPFDGLAHALVGIRSQNIINPFHVWLIRQIHLLSQPHMGHHKHHRALFVIAQNPHIFRRIYRWIRKLDTAAVGRTLSFRRQWVIIPDKPNFDTRHVGSPIGRKNQIPLVLIRCIMKHIGANFGSVIGAQIPHHHFFAIHHLPVAREHKIIPNVIHQRHNGFPLR